MFEYAFGRAVALKNNTELVLDLSQYELDPQRRFMLDAFPIRTRVATPEEVAKLIGRNRLVKKLLPLFGRSRAVHEPQFAFYPPALEAKNPCYLDGYWQSEKYFADITPTLRKEFVLRKPLSEAAQKITNEMQKGASVSIHVRRGDYSSSQFALLGAEYYMRAIAKVQETVQYPKYFVFSDNIEWVRKNLVVPDVVFVSGRGLSDIEELILMSRCAHHIIANSSFSWWGAWLNPNKKKVIIAPKKWFVTNVHDTKDLLPTGWLTI
jgi:hypothetical protein